MIKVDEALLREFREKLRCEYCGQAKMRPLQPHHLWCRGMGGGGRLDIRINLVALCGTVGTREGCHDKAHRGEITRSELLALVAAREGCLQREIKDNIALLLRTPKEEAVHKCPVEVCQLQVADSRFMCPRHWFRVPCELRPGIHRAYQDYLDEKIGLEELRDIQRPVVELVSRAVKDGAA